MTANSSPRTIPHDGAAETVDGRYVLRFERRFRHPIEKVWDALTTPARIKEWMGEVEIELDLVEGGQLNTRTTGPPELVEAIIAEAGEGMLVARDTVLRVEPPVLFEHTFGGDPGSVARWELRRDGEGTRLTLTHTEPPGFDVANGPRDLAGWHTLLDLLGSALDGKPMPWLRERWEEHRSRYAADAGG
ncbi:MAG TPA: SRPBCC family protein [Acidimicrobiia bacterium]|nr:SRPBCC family protein [Acidimicrobiia bacterium]